MGVGVGLMIASTVMAARQAQQQGQAAANAAKHQAAAARMNNRIAQRKAAQINDAGSEAENRRRIETKIRQGEARAGAAGRGVQVDSGSALTEDLDIAQVGAADAFTIRNNHARRAADMLTQGQQFANQAQVLEQKGDFVKDQGNINAGATLLTGAVGVGQTKVAQKWYTTAKV